MRWYENTIFNMLTGFVLVPQTFIKLILLKDLRKPNKFIFKNLQALIIVSRNHLIVAYCQTACEKPPKWNQ